MKYLFLFLLLPIFTISQQNPNLPPNKSITEVDWPLKNVEWVTKRRPSNPLKYVAGECSYINPIPDSGQSRYEYKKVMAWTNDDRTSIIKTCLKLMFCFHGKYFDCKAGEDTENFWVFCDLDGTRMKNIVWRYEDFNKAQAEFAADETIVRGPLNMFKEIPSTEEKPVSKCNCVCKKHHFLFMYW